MDRNINEIEKLNMIIRSLENESLDLRKNMKRLRSLVITQESSLSTETMNFALCTKNQTTKKIH